MGRDTQFPLSSELEANLADLLSKLNKFRDIYGLPMFVSSGYRPDHYNTDAGGASNSPHKTCQACDFHDPRGDLAQWILNNIHVLEDTDLYMESPDHTHGWVHLQSRAIPSGHRVFIP